MARPTSKIDKIQKRKIKIRIGNLTDIDSLISAVKNVDVVINLAAHYSFWGNSKEFWKVNVLGNRNLLEASLRQKVKHFIYLSSTEAIGPVQIPPGTEETPLNPTYPYGRSKVEAERVVRYYGELGLPYTILRPTGIYGPGNLRDVAF